MARTTRSRDQRLRDRVELARMHLAGVPLGEIANRLGISPAQVSYDVRWLRAQWLQTMRRDFATKMAEELARIDDVERHARVAWEASQGAQERTAINRDPSEGHDRVRTRVTRWTSPGDPRYLHQVQWCIEQRLKLYGAYDQQTDGERDADGFPVVRLSVEQARAMAQRANSVHQRLEALGGQAIRLPTDEEWMRLG